jgi:hypothetical protein
MLDVEIWKMAVIRYQVDSIGMNAFTGTSSIASRTRQLMQVTIPRAA